MTWPLSRLVALGAALLLAVGTFLPLIQVPKGGAITLLEADDGAGGYAMLALAAVGAGLAMTRWRVLVAGTGLAALGLLATIFVRASTEIERARLRLGEGIGDDPVGQLRNLVRVNATYSYGWAVLAIGGLAMVGAGVLAWRERRRLAHGGQAALRGNDDEGGWRDA